LAWRAQLFREQTKALRLAYASRLAEPIPDALIDVIEGWRASFLRRRAILAAMALTLTVTIGGLGWFGAKLDSDRQKTTAVTIASLASLAAPGRGTPAAINGRAMFNWLMQKMTSRHSEFPDLSSLGYKPVARDIVEVGGRRILRLEYRSSDDRNVDIFLQPRWRDYSTEFRPTAKGDIAIISWKEGPISLAVAGPLSPEQTLSVAKAVRRALRHGSPASMTPEIPSVASTPTASLSLLRRHSPGSVSFRPTGDIRFTQPTLPPAAGRQE
jgi:anti-sigma factor RsiW